MSINTYDEVPYPSSSFPQTHPVKLATMGRLFGLTPAEPQKCSVLELGCADGANLIPFAQNYPDSTFVGIDLSAKQVERGQKAVAESGLTNIALHHQDIRTFDSQGQKFDYIIVHGIFSWVPEEVRERILEICNTLLTDNGIAYISYNALPGWHMRGMIRDMMLFHTAQFPDVQQRIGQSRALVKFLVDSVPTENNPYGQFLKNELTAMQGWQDGYLRHDFLEEENKAFYFHEFAANAARHNLQYLGEPELSAMLAGNFPPQVQETLSKVGRNIVQMEQYMDFLRNRMFRMTLLVKNNVKISRNIDASILRDFYFGAVAAAVKPEPNLQPGEKEEFRLVSGVTFTSDSALVKVMLVSLQRSMPNHVSFSKLMADVRAKLSGGASAIREAGVDQREEAVVLQQLLLLFSKGLIDVLAVPHPTLAVGPEKLLKAPAFMRYQALNDGRHVTNLRHVSVKVDAFSRHVLALLDGTREPAAVIDGMAAKVRAGLFNVQENGAPISDDTRLKAVLAPRIGNVVEQLIRLSFLQPA
ncbi:MAG TPA: class I SAM-dependent methyltransferase [Opitutaceae bacterium]|jgi:methyltransferase-like protein/cyclopropane fatty-acyl-phospholipid synthase-like methyltransferase|nr:class I SAM-dependent methyltransferase [Opitutaceae bacterium]